ncbi:DUF6283 family protein [Nonomuraea wenchangensis]|uniref:DUF6283 family protein n=1 Tax=Nonomuraea wenchangensis TaxID=568860 RepID=UPI003320CB85
MSDSAASTARASAGAEGRPAGPPAEGPCGTCPYRRDVLSGLWAREEYDKLRGYDRPTFAQPVTLWLCHQHGRSSPRRRVCAGWAGYHDGIHTAGGPGRAGDRAAQSRGRARRRDLHLARAALRLRHSGG